MYKICRFSKPISGIIKNTLPIANNSEINSSYTPKFYSSSPNNNFNNSKYHDNSKHHSPNKETKESASLKVDNLILKHLSIKKSSFTKDEDTMVTSLITEKKIDEAIKYFNIFSDNLNYFKKIEHETFTLLLLEVLKQPQQLSTTDLMKAQEKIHMTKAINLIVTFLRHETNKVEALQKLKKADQQINEFIQNNNEIWFKFLSRTNGDLILMKEILPESTYKSTEFLNFWLERISRSFNLVTDFDLVWKLLEYMVQNEIPLRKKPIDSFTSFVFQSDQPLTPNQIKTINDIELQYPSIARIFNDLKLKLKFYPSNNFNQYNENQFSKADLVRSLEKLQNMKMLTPNIVVVYVNLASRVYPIDQNPTNISKWQQILGHSNNKNKNKNYITPEKQLLKQECIIAVCLALKRANKIDLLQSFIKENSNIIGGLNLKVLVDILSPLSPLEQASFIENDLKYKRINPASTDYVEQLQSKLLNPNDFPKLDKFIQKKPKFNENLESFVENFSNIYFK
ncbi:hypothetical protein DICPUDRAFT_82784 [Dictyostelium purpureum]|uniref:Uncharacterized protein n=1 Tax=Dictyostelium purpureum TaxID=5786 RepID=F0ZXL2_DICPU|nr:uncharacterized protein DICPUDRAFT_82784 [Dictyostelium purpureum]EGC31316.1 hypothetical protein DICPUDRAFT_82784 [Dictyostelium purpureum]|eukprot:XP_003292160.1 hypothetical protein DICPUDRAFT_82784 [Dictyostelium purpureum]